MALPKENVAKNIEYSEQQIIDYCESVFHIKEKYNYSPFDFYGFFSEKDFLISSDPYLTCKKSLEDGNVVDFSKETPDYFFTFISINDKFCYYLHKDSFKNFVIDYRNYILNKKRNPNAKDFVNLAYSIIKKIRYMRDNFHKYLGIFIYIGDIHIEYCIFEMILIAEKSEEIGFLAAVQSIIDIVDSSEVPAEFLNPNPERDTSPSVEMPKGDESPLESKDKIQNGFSAAADPEAIGKVLTAAREEAGMTKAAVAAEMATVPKSIIRLEKGEQNPTIQTIDRFAKALGYTVRIEFLKNEPE